MDLGWVMEEKFLMEWHEQDIMFFPKWPLCTVKIFKISLMIAWWELANQLSQRIHL